MNELIQWIITGIIVACAIAYFIFRRRRGSCCNCPDGENCSKRKGIRDKR